MTLDRLTGLLSTGFIVKTASAARKVVFRPNAALHTSYMEEPKENFMP